MDEDQGDIASGSGKAEKPTPEKTPRKRKSQKKLVKKQKKRGLYVSQKAKGPSTLQVCDWNSKFRYLLGCLYLVP